MLRPSQARSRIWRQSRSALGVEPAMATVRSPRPLAHIPRRIARPTIRHPHIATGAAINQVEKVTREKLVEVLVAKRPKASAAAVAIQERRTGLASDTKCSDCQGR